ncbi:hypothetical protein, partial [Enterococcus faecium]|uniref:hypothetical protein n=1 Tax=Enterococcus faecium TaxID=1352 RepID=UPI003CF8D096
GRKSNLFFCSSLEPQGIDPYYSPDFLPKIVAYSIKIRKNIKKGGRKSPPFFRFKTPKPKDIKFGQLTTAFLREGSNFDTLTAC